MLHSRGYIRRVSFPSILSFFQLSQGTFMLMFTYLITGLFFLFCRKMFSFLDSFMDEFTKVKSQSILS